MLRWLLALLLVPFLDAILLGGIVVYVDVVGIVEMVAIVVLTGLVGMLLVRAEGRRTIGKIQRSLARGEPPTNELLDGALLIAAGAFLLTPGLVTDLLGFLLVVPPTRVPIRMVIKRYAVVPALDRRTGGFATGAVWTAGFPDGDSRTSDEPGDTVNLGRSEYHIDRSENGGYAVEFGDGETTDPGGSSTGRDEEDATDSDDRGDAVGR